MLLALTGYETALLVVAVSFIVFALIMALVVPRVAPGVPREAARDLPGGLRRLLRRAADRSARPRGGGGGRRAGARGDDDGRRDDRAHHDRNDRHRNDRHRDDGHRDDDHRADPAREGDPVAGKEIFLGASGCAGCHTLADAGSTGTIGPNLDALKPSYDTVVAQVTNGGGGMPAFGDTLTEKQIQDVAAYVSSRHAGLTAEPR